MAATVCRSGATPPGDLTELRLLVELPALRTLADRGLTDQELAIIRNLADATMRSARHGDVPGYLHADMAFHLYLLDLAGDQARSEIARLLLARGGGSASPAEPSRHFMAARAREHRELVDMLTGDLASAPDDLLKHHVSALEPDRPAAGPDAARHGGEPDMADRMTPGWIASPAAGADLDAFLRRRGDVPTGSRSALIRSLGRVRRSDDPVVTFARLPGACVPDFADGCQVELSDGAEPVFRARHPASAACDPEATAGADAGPGHMLHTPFRVASRTGYPSYAGIVTHWWTRRAPSESDAVIAELIVRQLNALVDQERLLAAVARAEERAASLALEAITGRTVNLATGIVMRQHGLPPDDAEDLLRRSARMAGRGLPQMAAGVVISGSLPAAYRGLSARPGGTSAGPRPGSARPAFLLAE